ncbi:UDP-N-acetylmuramoyl-tripeptide--D-alanyl-D-alanine ligase [Bacillus seohaeanensis]|jgi:UDP-N-acetylmuramoyl-tripeptide--D-alanyl-D-alanine ligase|uniref:UDP-N-acetylmuramoyl-tripeptide--D-alanyl-D-alanine ligase n=1 Tax=Bacillus seohaeanensis TaxID=284580 RepID=A0ABW5RM59_9BACI
MMERTIKEIAAMIKVENDISSFENIKIKGVSIDTRTIEKGNLFIPFKGEKVDGHRYVEQALEKGASAALWEKGVPNPPKNTPLIIVEDGLLALQALANEYRHQLNLKVVGVTGSNGKTTTKDMIAKMLSVKYNVKKTAGNFNNHIGLPLTILSLNEDTEVAVLEMGMSGFGEIELLSNISHPDAAIVTNIGESHLQDLGSREGITKAKLEIVKGLKEDGLFVYFGDEPLLKAQVNELDIHRVETFGKNDTNTIYPTKVEMDKNGSVFSVQLTEEEFILPVLGQHNILNALGAMLIAKEFGISFAEIKESLQSLKLTKMRMELVEGEKGEKIINDAYNASPTSMRAAVELVAELEGYQTKILVLGDMLELGEKEEEFHREIGEQIDPEKIEYVFTYGKLGRFIAEGAKSQFAPTNVFHFEEKSQLVSKLIQLIKGDELILVKASRGMRLEEVIDELKK